MFVNCTHTKIHIPVRAYRRRWCTTRSIAIAYMALCCHGPSARFGGTQNDWELRHTGTYVRNFMRGIWPFCRKRYRCMIQLSHKYERWCSSQLGGTLYSLRPQLLWSRHRASNLGIWWISLRYPVVRWFLSRSSYFRGQCPIIHEKSRLSWFRRGNC